MYFMKDGAYCHDASQIRDAHNWCKAMTRTALEHGERVVVANTFTWLVEMQPYFEMCKNIRIIEATGQWPNVHGVPITSQIKGYPFEVPLNGGGALGVALVDQIKSLDWKSRQAERKGQATAAELADIKARIEALLKLP